MGQTFKRIQSLSPARGKVKICLTNCSTNVVQVVLVQPPNAPVCPATGSCLLPSALTADVHTSLVRAWKSRGETVQYQVTIE